MNYSDLKAFTADFDLLGVADPYSAELQRAPEGHKSQDYLPGVKSVISLGVIVTDEKLQTTPSNIYSQHYDTLNAQLNTGAYELSRRLLERGFTSMSFPETDSYRVLWEQYKKGYTSFVPVFNHMAVAAGLGRMGACGVVLTPEHGPRQRWVSVITSAALPSGTQLKDEVCLSKKGENCGKCAEGCAIHAIDDGGTDVRRCWIRWTELRDKGLACGLCIKACPVGRHENSR